MDNIFKNFESMREMWGEMFTSIAGTVARGIKGKEKRIFKEFQDNFGIKFQEYLGGTYDIFVNKPLLPFMIFGKFFDNFSKASSGVRCNKPEGPP